VVARLLSFRSADPDPVLSFSFNRRFLVKALTAFVRTGVSFHSRIRVNFFFLSDLHLDPPFSSFCSVAVAFKN